MLRRSTLPIGLSVLVFVSTTVAQPGGFPGGPPGGLPFEPPQPGRILPGFLHEQLKLTDEQKKQVVLLQQDVDAKLDKLFTDEQRKQWSELKQAPLRFGPGGFGPGGFGPGGFGPGGSRVSRLDDIKKQLGATDEEWKVSGPKLQKVIAARQALSGELRGPEAGDGLRPGLGGAGSVVSQALADLKATLDDPKHTMEDMEEKLAGVRQARRKARADLDAAQKDLLQLLTPSQAAVLVSMGYVD